MEDKKKVLLLAGTVSSYRVPIYNLINKKYDLTVAYDVKDESGEEREFNVIQLKPRTIKSLKFFPLSFYKLCNKFDAVIFVADMHYLSYVSLPFFKRKYKTLAWTIGIRASYKRNYDLKRKHDFLDKVYCSILKRCDALIFYMKEATSFWKDTQLNKEKIFEAHNTVVVEPIDRDKYQKDSLLFVGTLYKEKNIYELIDAYIDAYKQDANIPVLNIVGDGAEYANLQRIIAENNFEKRINLLGRITDERILSELFAKAHICISPNQAGLSVLKSLGYGVPFVTRSNAITGGELLNIKDGYNGILYNEYKELVDIILQIQKDPEKFKMLGENAYDFYQTNATPQKMADGVISALDYVLKV